MEEILGEIERVIVQDTGVPLTASVVALQVEMYSVPLEVYLIDPMIGENRQLVTDEPVEFEI